MYLFTISYGRRCNGSRKWSLVDSVDDSRSSSSIRSISMPNFEVLDARIASALNKIIHNSHFRRRISLEEQRPRKRDRFPSRYTDCLLDLRSLPGHWNPRFCRKLHRLVHYCSFEMTIFRNSILSGTEIYCL